MFEARRKQFLEAMGPDAVAIVAGGRVVTRSNDTEYPFRQDSDFWYLTGFDHPDAVAIFRTDGGPAYSLFVQPRDPDAEVWTGYRPGVEGAVSDFGADEAHECGQLEEKLPELLKGARNIFHALGRRPELDRKLVEIQELLRRQSRAGIAPADQLVDPRSLLHEMRIFKTEHELEIMRRAADISREAHAETARLAQPGRHEYELEAQLAYVFRRRGGSGPAYSSIVAGGANAAVLHYVANDQPLRSGQLCLIDAGAELEGYASDITRTYPVGGRFEGAGRDVYETVLAAQEEGLAQCRAGTTLPDIHNATIRKLVDGMCAIGLLSGDTDELIEKETYKRYYMHGTSHWLGLDVHDVGSYARGEKARILEPGMVFTVEPGLYIAHGDEQAPEAFRGIGVRIEDDVIITPDGIENLNAAIPKRPDAVEAWVQASGD
jgi:Xaa-Pro aminopeptidase